MTNCEDTDDERDQAKEVASNQGNETKAAKYECNAGHRKTVTSLQVTVSDLLLRQIEVLSDRLARGGPQALALCQVDRKDNGPQQGVKGEPTHWSKSLKITQLEPGFPKHL